MRLSVLIPVFNEAPTVRRLLDRVREIDLEALGLTKQLVIVDDGSNDETAAEVRAFLAAHPHVDAQFVQLPVNRGKGVAVREALTHATGELCIIQDADLEYDPADWPGLLAPLASGETDVVFGSRGLPLGPNQHRRRLYQIGVTIAHLTIGVLYAKRFTDVATCYKALRTELLRRLEPRRPRFDFDVEVACKLVTRGVPIAEHPITYRPRYKDEGKKIRWRDFFESMWTIVRVRFVDPERRGFSWPPAAKPRP
jgi:glycosyltransferase involved in cell wall biosynthesis